MTLNEFKAKLLDVVREAYAAGIPALDISLACDAVAAAAGALIPPNSPMVVPGPPVEPPTTATVTGCSPTSVEIGAADMLLTVNGTGFTATNKIVFNGGEEPTTLVSATKLTTTIKPSTASTPGVYPVTVTGADGSATFEFTEEPDEPASRGRRAA